MSSSDGMEPRIRHGVLLPRVGVAPGADQLSPTVAALPVPDDAPAPDGPRHRRSGVAVLRGRLALLGGVCAIALVAVASAVAIAKVGTARMSGTPTAGDPGSPAAQHRAAPPAPSTDVRPSEVAASARVTLTPAHSARPHATATGRSAAAHHWRSLVVHATYVLNPGGSVRSNRLSLSLRTDGDLVLRDEHGRTTWSSGTHAPGARAVFQADGNFVVYQGDQTLWSSRTEGHDGATLVLGADGAMRIAYGSTSLWSTGTG